MKKIKKNVKKIITLIILGLVLQISAAYILDIVLGFLPKYAEDYSSNMEYLNDLNTNTYIAVLLLSPVIEEVIFRGVVLSLLKKISGFWIANFIQAVLFGIYHGNIVQGVYAFILGLLFGYVFHTCKGLWTTIILHMSVNFSGLFIVKRFPENLSSPIRLALFIVSTVIFIFLFKKLRKM